MMFKAKVAYSGFSVNDLAKAKAFYTEILGLRVDGESMGLSLQLPGGGTVFVYPKEDHLPATFTILNFEIDNIDEAVDQLRSRGVQFEHYEGVTDEKGVFRGISKKHGPDIAWFKDPAGNILSVIQSRR